MKARLLSPREDQPRRRVRAALAWSPALLALLALPAPAPAQVAPLIFITEPAEWQAGKPIVIPAGKTVRVTGVVSHPSGVVKVLVDGEEADVEPDPSGTDLFKFEKVITAGTKAREISVTIVPKESQNFTKKFGLELQPGAAPPARDTTAAKPPTQPVTPPVAPPVTPPRDTARAAPTPETPQQLGLPNPWKGFTMRAIGYGGLAAAGAYFMTKTTTSNSVVCTGGDCFNREETKASGKGLGLALIGVGVAGAVIDGIMTSGKAKAQAQPTNVWGSADTPLRLERPGLSATAERVTLELVRLRF
ncbi:MAG: hypothetical protein FIB01_03665 [Gemmatimonadetes bacterium]|nr:hypothetical protein [Gemmatimonadota bacterium]